MNAELEALLKALDAVLNARTGAEARRLEEIYNSQVEDALGRYPAISREKLMALVAFAYRRWVRAQIKPPSIPPKA